MFSELIKREVTKLVLVTFLYMNLSPAFCMQGMPEYVINVEHRRVMGAGAAEQNAFVVRAVQLVQEGAESLYKTIADQIIYPFMAATAIVNTGARLYEILQNVKTKVAEKEQLSEEIEIETQLSRGFCLNIPEIGDLLISHDGDVS